MRTLRCRRANGREWASPWPTHQALSPFARRLPQIDARRQDEVIREGFEELIQENDFVVVEGTGHTGGLGVFSATRLFPIENSFGNTPRRSCFFTSTRRAHTERNCTFHPNIHHSGRSSLFVWRGRRRERRRHE